MAYTPSHLSQYFTRINLPPETRTAFNAGFTSLESLTTLLHHHLAAVPFENTALHYTADRPLVLSPPALFDKIVRRRQGGTCFQVTRLFAEVLLALGYTLYTTGARTNKATSVAAVPARGDPPRTHFGDWQHMILVVRIAGTDYLVDAGFGPQGPVQPVPLVHGHEFSDGRLGRTGRLVHAPIDQGRARHLKYWRLQFRGETPPADGKVWAWTDAYAFTESEWLEADYAAVERGLRANKRAWFLFRVVAFRVLLDEDGVPEGWVLLWHDGVRWVKRGKVVERRVLGGEEERVEVLERVFGIALSEEERREIVGMVSALPGVRAKM
ncbi:arylamine N-acetyltransferase 5 [Aspergillus floccosus]